VLTPPTHRAWTSRTPCPLPTLGLHAGTSTPHPDEALAPVTLGMPRTPSTPALLVGAKRRRGAAGDRAPLGWWRGNVSASARARWFEGSLRRAPCMVRATHTPRAAAARNYRQHLLGESDFGLTRAPRPIISCVLRFFCEPLQASQPARRYLPRQQSPLRPGSISPWPTHLECTSGLAMPWPRSAARNSARQAAQAHHVGRR